MGQNIGHGFSRLTESQWDMVKCVVVLRHPDGLDRFYGQFDGYSKAEEWCDKQVENGFHGTFIIMPLRHPDVKRSYDDFWTPDAYRIDQKVWEDFDLF